MGRYQGGNTEIWVFMTNRNSDIPTNSGISIFEISTHFYTGICDNLIFVFFQSGLSAQRVSNVVNQECNMQNITVLTIRTWNCHKKHFLEITIFLFK